MTNANGSRIGDWTVLDTNFGNGSTFLRIWNDHRAGARPAGTLHYVALAPEAPSVEVVRQSSQIYPALMDQVDPLRKHWSGLARGFHRFRLDGGKVSLTLCVGDRLKLLREQQFLADEVMLELAQKEAEKWDLWQFKALARLCRRQTQVSFDLLPDTLQGDMRQCGFVMAQNPEAGAPCVARYDPPWDIKRTRTPWADPAANHSHANKRPGRTCAVVGAGLSGASVAAVLAQRGWKVLVLDLAATPAQGASGLPVGLMVPHVSSDDSPRSRLSRSGIHLTRQWAEVLLTAERDWRASGVLERFRSTTAPDAGGSTEMADLWHSRAAWVKPAALVQAWLAQTGIEFRGDCEVATISQVLSPPDTTAPESSAALTWQLRDPQGRLVALADHVVLACAQAVTTLFKAARDDAASVGGTPALMQVIPAMQGLKGQVSWARQRPTLDKVLPAFPVNGQGSVIAHVPWQNNLAWFVGATYTSDATEPLSVAQQHQLNFERLARLLPDCAGALADDFERGSVRAWSQTRCVTKDRLPVVGPLNQERSLWVSTAMGSRGLSFAALCAELLAAQMNSEPLPVEASLAAFLDSRRAVRS